MDTFIQVSIGVIAVAFVILIYSVVQTMKVLKAALDEMRLTIGQVRTDVSHITVEMKEAIRHTNAMTLDVRTKLNSLDVVFAAVNDIGQTIHSITGPVKEVAASILPAREKRNVSADAARRANIDRSRIAEAIADGVISSLRIWKKIKK